MRLLVSLAAVGFVAGSVLHAPIARAQSSGPPVTGSLVDLINSGIYNFNRLERLSAIANQASYNQLVGTCSQASAPTAACPADSFRVFANVRELVHTANEILANGGPTFYSLQTDAEGLGFALRWTAAEELSAPGTASTEFANAQLASVLSRINALRLGASGFSVASYGVPKQGGAAAADDPIGSRWGGFLNGTYGYGKRDPSELEDAFAFDDQEAVLGVDYRFTPSLVAGVMVGYTKQTIDFDSTQSVVDGGIESDGIAATIYGLYEWNGPYVSLALAWQQLSIDIKRVITYPSFNINTDSVYATATGTTDSTTLTASGSFGWPIAMRAFGIEPYVRVEYRDITIDAFKESSVNNIGPQAGQPAGFDFAFDAQSLSSLDGAVGLKFQYVFTPSFGVIIPYAKAEMHHNFDTDPFTVNATYNGQSAASNPFSIPSEERDSSFQTYAAGASLVLRAGWQGFLQYEYTAGLDFFDQRVISGGIRGEF